MEKNTAINSTINLPDEDVQALKVKATARGISAEQYALQSLEKDPACRSGFASHGQVPRKLD